MKDKQDLRLAIQNAESGRFAIALWSAQTNRYTGKSKHALEQNWRLRRLRCLSVAAAPDGRGRSEKRPGMEHICCLLSLLLGIAVRPLLQYLVHRFILHRVPPFSKSHVMRHATPAALVGTPTWLSDAIVGGAVILPLWREAGLNLASGLTTGIMLGYLWYVSVHHAVHHWRARRGSYLYRAKLRHALHHRTGPLCHFGVSTQWWDRAFGSTQMLTRTR